MEVYETNILIENIKEASLENGLTPVFVRESESWNRSNKYGLFYSIETMPVISMFYRLIVMMNYFDIEK